MTGHYQYLVETRDAVLSTARMSQAARARAMGKPIPPPVATKSHRVTVDLRTGERTVTTAERTTTKPRPKPTKIRKPRRARLNAQNADIIYAVSDAWDISVYSLMSAKRPARLFRPRFAAALLFRERGLSYPQIARALGRQDHTSARHEVTRASHLLHTDKEWAARYHESKRLLESGK